MEYSKLSEIGAVRIGEVLGYDIYAPKYMVISPFLSMRQIVYCGFYLTKVIHV